MYLRGLTLRSLRGLTLRSSLRSILPGHSVGNDALVGAGAVVMRDVKPGQHVFGNPARAFC